MPGSYHFSVDDVFAGLVEDGHPLLDFLSDFNSRHGARVDLYVFQRAAVAGALRTLDAIAPALACRLDGLEWLRLGPHGDDYETAPHAQTPADQRAMLARIFRTLDRAAPASGRARWVRLHYFSECFELAPELRAHGVDALLTTDKPVGSYRLPEPCRLGLLRAGRTEHAGLGFVRSHLRLENLAREAPPPGEVERRLDKILTAHGTVVIFTHEIDLMDERTRAMADRCFSHLRRVGVRPL